MKSVKPGLVTFNLLFEELKFKDEKPAFCVVLSLVTPLAFAKILVFGDPSVIFVEPLVPSPSMYSTVFGFIGVGVNVAVGDAVGVTVEVGVGVGVAVGIGVATGVFVGVPVGAVVGVGVGINTGVVLGVSVGADVG